MLQIKAEANAYRRLQEMETATGAHFLERHGAHLDLKSQYDLAAYGIDPATGKKGRIPPSATRFWSHRDQLNVISNTEAIYARGSDRVSFISQSFKFDSAMGGGFNRALQFGVQYSAIVYISSKAGRAVTAFPIYGE